MSLAGFPYWHSDLRIWYCHCCGLGHLCGTGLIPGPRNSAYCRSGRKKVCAKLSTMTFLWTIEIMDFTPDQPFNHDLHLRVFFFFFFCLFRVALAAYGGAHARGRIGAVAAGLHNSHSNTGSKPHLQPIPELIAMPDR